MLRRHGLRNSFSFLSFSSCFIGRARVFLCVVSAAAAAAASWVASCLFVDKRQKQKNKEQRTQQTSLHVVILSKEGRTKIRWGLFIETVRIQQESEREREKLDVQKRKRKY